MVRRRSPEPRPGFSPTQRADAQCEDVIRLLTRLLDPAPIHPPTSLHFPEDEHLL